MGNPRAPHLLYETQYKVMQAIYSKQSHQSCSLTRCLICKHSCTSSARLVVTCVNCHVLLVVAQQPKFFFLQAICQLREGRGSSKSRPVINSDQTSYMSLIEMHLIMASCHVTTIVTLHMHFN